MNTYYPIGLFGDVSNDLSNYVQGRSRRCFAATAAEKMALSNLRELEERRSRLKQAFLDALGGVPEPVGELEPVWGELRERKQYSVQNVLFQAEPQVYVTATVWRPVGWKGQRPGMVFPCGHWEFPREGWKDGYQENAARLAANGYVTILFDPAGQGEQKICWDPVLQQSFAGKGSAEHQHVGMQCELIGHNIVRYMVQHGMRSYDLLASLPEVDAARIAVTGNSGGGTQTACLMSADERFAAAVCVNYITTREAYMERPHWHDEEQNFTGAILRGLDYEDHFTTFAPRPAAIGAVTWDYFPIEGAELAYERLRRVYALYGVEDRVALFTSDGPHDYDMNIQRAAIGFFNRFLQPGVEFRDLEEFTPETPQSQRNTPTGQVASSFPGAKLAFEQHREAVLASRAGRHAPSAKELVERLGLPTERCPLAKRVIEQVQEGYLKLEKGLVHTEQGIVMSYLRLAGEEPRAALIHCCDQGNESIGPADEALLRKLAHEGVAIYLMEPRGIGEVKSRPFGYWDDDARFANLWLSHYLRKLGTSFGALQAFDLTRACDFARQREGDVPLTLMAQGFLGWSGAIAAVLDGRLSALCLDSVPASIDRFATTRTAVVPPPYSIPGILQIADLPELVAGSGVKRLLMVQPRDTDDRVIGQPEWETEYAPGWKAAAAEMTVLCKPDRVERIAALAQFLGG